MKNLLIYVGPRKDFDGESKIAVKIQIDNSLDLGWKREDIMLVTNFPYEYNRVKSLLVSDDNYCTFCPTSTKINVIVELFQRNLIKKSELYWFHDPDAYELHKIEESELDLGKADLGLTDRGLKPRFDTGIFFFKSSARDIFGWLKDLMNKYQVNEELVLMTLTTNNLLWITGTETDARDKFIPFNFSGSGNLSDRVKKINISYNFGPDSPGITYEMAEMASKPLKVAHFHFSDDLLLDSFMYGKNDFEKPLMPKRLIKIFHQHGVKGTYLKKMKNLMVYLNPERKFIGKAEDLIKRQIDNSLKLGWKKEDIILLTNFPYEYQGIKAVVVDDNLFCNTNDIAWKTNAIFQLLNQDAVKEAELWWFHDLDVFQLRKVDSPEIGLEGAPAGFIYGDDSKFDTSSIFFRKGSHKLFEWIRNRTCRLKADEAAALDSLASSNYRNINSMYKKLKSVKIFKHL